MGGLLDLVKADGLGGPEVVGGVLEVVGKILGLADVDELEAMGIALGSASVDESK